MEGDMLKGIFNRKDNGKQLVTTRIVQGDELIQVGWIYIYAKYGAKNPFFFSAVTLWNSE